MTRTGKRDIMSKIDKQKGTTMAERDLLRGCANGIVLSAGVTVMVIDAI